MSWRYPLDKFKLGTKFGVVDADHPNGHRGDDLNGVKEGTPLKAVNDGKIVLSVFSKILGNIVVLRVGIRFFGYCHMKSATMHKVGTKVKSGDVIGYLGNTGSASTGPHLHFTLGLTKMAVMMGKVLSPMKFLDKQIKLQESVK